ncbi:MAG TPA: protein kinase [Labilithrix sp.]
MHASPEGLPEGVQRDGARYELLGELASGGMATVYLGRMVGSMGLSRLVAIKSMHPQYAKDPTFASMFVDEARLTARLRHPNVVPTLDIVAESGRLLIVMEYVEGESLAALIKLVREAGASIPPNIACAILHDALLGLHEAHEACDDDGVPLAIIHRDVSPQNVLLGLDGLARVLDFGVAKARRTVHFSHDGEIKGKVPYMPPEQLFGEAIDRRVDVYAAGVLLWEALCGARLFEGPSEEIIVKRIADGTIAAPSTRAKDVSPKLDAVVLKALATDPAARFATALEMAEGIAAAITLPTRTDVAAWVKKYARVRTPAPSGPSAYDVHQTTTDAGAIVAAVRRSQSRPAAGASRGIVVALAAVAIACAGFAVMAGTRAEKSAAAAPHEAPIATAIPTAPATITATPIASAIPTATPVAAAIATAAKAHVARPEATKPVEAAPVVTTSEPASCRPPYTLDADGHRHYKVECL